MARLDWNRTRPGNGGFDERAGGEWRRGPRETSDGECTDRAKADMLASPDVYWATNLARSFSVESGETHAQLKAAAGKAAREVYRLHGINTLLARVLSFHERASSLRPFPSAYFAVYFDLAAMRITLAKNVRHDPPPRRNVKKFFAYGEVQHRAMMASKAMVEAEGGFRGLADRILGTSGPTLTTRGFPGR